MNALNFRRNRDRPGVLCGIVCRLINIFNSSILFALLTGIIMLRCSHVFCQPVNDQFTQYTVQDGLPDGAINSIAQDTSGFIWITTSSGLSRFDGLNFKTFRYDPVDSSSLRSNRIDCIFMDHKGRLWVLANPWLHLYHPDGGWFEHFNASGLTSEYLQDICREVNNQLIIIGHSTLFKFDMTEKKFIVFNHDGISPAFYFNFVSDEDGIEWISTQSGLIRYDPKTKNNFFVDSAFQSVNKTFVSTISFLYLLPDGQLLAATREKGILLVNRKTSAVRQVSPYNNNPGFVLRDMCRYSDSSFLTLCDSGVFVFNWRTGTSSDFKVNALTTNEFETIFNIFSDREGIVWLGGKYLEKYDFKDFNVHIIPSGKVPDPKPFLFYNNLFKRKNGTFLFGGFSGMATYDPLTNRLTKINSESLDPELGPKSRLVANFGEDENGNTWCYSRPKILRFSIKDSSLEHVKEYHIPGRVSDITALQPGHKGNVLLTSYGSGFIRFDTNGKTFTFFNPGSKAPSQFTDSLATAFCVDHHGCTWVATTMGINKIEKDGLTVRQFGQNKTNNPSVIDWKVNDIKEDKQGIIWFTTWEHGIGRIDPGNDSVTFLSIREGLPTCWYWKLNIDDENNLWAYSLMGMLKLNTVTLHNDLYTEEEGFPNPADVKDIHYSNYSHSLYLLTSGAIFEIETKNIDHPIKIPETSITGFSVFNKEVPVVAGRDIILNYKENFVNIQFACLLFHNVKQIKYAYKMEGIDADWVYCNFKRNAAYTNLPPGHYSFLIKAQGPAGVWNKPTVLTIVITPPFWQAWWFYLLELIAATAFVIWVVRLYTTRKLTKQKAEFEKLQAVSDERVRIAAEMHDELGSGLTSIRLLSEIASGKIVNEINPKAEIDKIEKSATILSENLREIIWTMNTRFDKLDDFIVYIRLYAVEYFDDTPIEFQFNSPELIPEVTLNGELRRNIFLCIKEALHNIVKHSRATRATLTFKLGGNTLITEIIDNGIGIDIKRIDKFGNGLNTMKERLNKFNGSLEIEVNGGTKLRLKVTI